MGTGRNEGRKRRKKWEGEKWKEEGTEEMDQLLQCLLCKHEDMSLIPQNLNDNVACGGTCLSLQPWGGGSRQISGAP